MCIFSNLILYALFNHGTDTQLNTAFTYNPERKFHQKDEFQVDHFTFLCYIRSKRKPQDSIGKNKATNQARTQKSVRIGKRLDACNEVHYGIYYFYWL